MRSKWSSKSLGSRLQHSLFYITIQKIGWPFAYAMLFFVVFWYSLSPTVRKRSAPYLSRAFPGASHLSLWRRRFLLYWTFGAILVDRARSGITGKFTTTACPEDEACLQKLANEGQGVILLTGHVGCWQLALPALELFRKRAVHVVMHRDPGDHDKHYHEHGKHAAPFAAIDPAGGIGSTLRMLQVLQRGEILGMMGDRPFGKATHTVPAPFLGADIPFPFTPYLLAARTGAPIAICFALRTGIGKAHLRLAGVIHVPRGLGKTPQAYLPYASCFRDALAEAVAKEPYQFFNFYNMWAPS